MRKVVYTVYVYENTIYVDGGLPITHLFRIISLLFPDDLIASVYIENNIFIPQANSNTIVKEIDLLPNTGIPYFNFTNEALYFKTYHYNLKINFYKFFYAKTNK